MNEPLQTQRTQREEIERVFASILEHFFIWKSLKGYRSVRAVGQRYRIIYKVELEKVVVLVVGVGLRKEGDKGDIYTLLQKLLEE
ncbi:MAG: type II toxin-antitoxin system RelE/ParE family toxin [Nostoc sp.]|uniref:type II toxin-antitoxin system RelE/ParE family toxin n=1 Tax=Nostoc sp. TaxID=1180 RepID=UPI002FFB84AB